MSLAAHPHSQWQAELRPRGAPANGEGHATGWFNFDFREMFRSGADARVLRDLTDRQLRDSGIDLSQAGRGRAASCRIATIANLEGLR